jgi:transposase
MIGLPQNLPILLCTQPVDFRNEFDGLTGIATNALGHNVADGSLFLFVNRKRARIKAMWWETSGLTLWYKRLEQGTVELPNADRRYQESRHYKYPQCFHATQRSNLRLNSCHQRLCCHFSSGASPSCPSTCSMTYLLSQRCRASFEYPDV